jgi:GH15 family glucan-1,4-alpha-glucosidase
MITAYRSRLPQQRMRHDPREVSAETNRSKAHSSLARSGSRMLVLAGEFDKAQTLLDRVVAVANDLGLLAEEFDSVASRQMQRSK